MSFKFFTNIGCKYLPCHNIGVDKFNCLFCYCPLYSSDCCGDYVITEDIKDCSECVIPHMENSWDIIIPQLYNL